jgi:hypothetical protein
MQRRWPAWIGLWSVLCAAGPAIAEEPYLDFVRGLRDRGYFDTAVYYLDTLATRSNLPDDMRQLIPYEKAVTLLENSKVTRSPEKQVEQLDQALAFLEQFVKESPNHPNVADANSERAQILIGKARVEIVQSRSPANQAAKADYQKRARDLITKARTVFDAAFKLHEAAWKQFGTFIDKAQFPEKFAARDQSEKNMIRAQLDLALCTYEESQTYDPESPDYKRLLNEAAAKFEQMHQRYRSQGGGLYARLYQGKCFEELGDLQKALGIYNELLSHPGDEGPLARLKDQTLQFKMIVLNSKERNDHQLVVDLGEEWLKQHRADGRTSVALGIRWETARAYEAVGDKRDLPKEDATRAWRLAREHAEQVNRFPGEFRDMSLALIQRLEVKLGGKEKQPVTFDAALGHGRQMITAIQEAKDALTAAAQQKKPADELKKLQQDFEVQLKDAVKMLDLALRLAGRQDDPKSVNTARYMYAYVLFLSRKNYEAAIIGEYVARTADKDDIQTGLDSAYISMAAYVQAFNDSKGNQDEKQVDIAFIAKACNLLTDKWPDSDKANDARMTLGRIYSQLKKPVQAAEWYGKVPEADAKFSEAQLAAGQAYWTAYLSASRMPETERPTPEQLVEWQKLATQYLQNGIARMSATVPKEGVAPAELIAGKMSMAQIVISQGQDAEAVKLLLDEPQSVIKAITVPDETKRPEKGVQSRQFASETYKLLLRAYIGGGKLDEARATMKTLEKVAGGEAGGDVTDLYVGLGKLLREELNRLQTAGEADRFNKLMTSFETFLNDLSQRKEGQSFGSLSWIGETYFALGEASVKDPSRSSSYYDKAATAFQDILTLAEQKTDFLLPDQVSAVKVRLARCHRFKKDFETAERLIADVIQQREKELRAQVEAAHIYKDWGSTGTTDNAEKLRQAINGVRDKKFWGWAKLASRLQSSLTQGRQEFLPMYVEARVNGADSRRRYALAQTVTKKRQDELEKCEAELVATVTVTKGLSEDQLAEINVVYKQILADSGKPVVELKPAKDIDPKILAAHAEEEAQEKTPQATKKKTAAAKAEPVVAESSSGLMFWLTFLGVLLAGSGAAAWIFLGQKKTKIASLVDHGPTGGLSMPSFGDAPDAPTGPSIITPILAAPTATPVAVAAAPPKPKPRPTTAAPTATAAAPKPTTKPTATAQPKPKPKPPAP